MANETALIQYIGKQPSKRDNVRDSGRVWGSYGATLDVPQNEKHSYLAHPGEWQEITAEQREQQKAAAAQSRTLAQELRDLIPSLDERALAELRAVVDSAIAGRRSQASAKATAVRVAGAPAHADSMDATMKDAQPAQATTNQEQSTDLSGKTETTVTDTPEQPAGAEQHTRPAGPAVVQASARIEKLVAVIRELDPKDPEQYRQDGQPRISVVRALTKIDDVTTDEIAQAEALAHPAKG